MQKLILYFFLLLLPLSLSSQRLNQSYTCAEYQYVDLVDSTKDFTETVDLVISLIVEDDYTGLLQIHTASGQLLSTYSLDGVKGIKGEEASAMLFKNCKLQNEKANFIYSIYLANKNDEKWSFFILLKDKSYEYYKELVII